MPSDRGKQPAAWLLSLAPLPKNFLSTPHISDPKAMHIYSL